MIWRAAVAALTVLLAGAAQAGEPGDEPIVLRLADNLPMSHFVQQTVGMPYMKAVTAATGGRVRFQHFPTEQLGKARDTLRLTQHGVADIGYVVPSYVSDKMPLASVAELPGSFRDVCQGTRAFWALNAEGRLLREREFTRNGVHPLIMMVVPSYQIVLSSHKTVARAQDFTGLKIRTAGAGMDMMVRALGATPLRLAAPEMYEAMARGTLDGAMTQYQSVYSYKLEALLRSGTVEENFGSIAFTYVINEARWRSLPENIRRILAEEGEKLSLAACRLLDHQEADARHRAEAEGMKPVVLSARDREALVAVYAGVRRQWADALDRYGKPGSQILDEWEAALAAAVPVQ